MGGEGGLSLQLFSRVTRMNYLHSNTDSVPEVLTLINRSSTAPQGRLNRTTRATWPTISQFGFWLAMPPAWLRT